MVAVAERLCQFEGVSRVRIEPAVGDRYSLVLAQHRVDIYPATTDHRPADALVIRPDAHIAWAATIREPADTAGPALRQALSNWFGRPLRARAATMDRHS